ncbi:MAG: hypothetical protein FWE54_06220 [Methanimicrococcus sp.]|nr:hypothetical protein [Methanimicrococcus sp.]
MEQIIDTIFKGLQNMKDNTVLFVPYFVFLIFVLALSFIVGIFIGYFWVVGADISSILPAAVVVSFVLLILTILISSYVTAGTIGMAKEAIATGTTTLKDMFKYGRQYTVRVFIATILLLIIQSVCVIFWLPLYSAYKNTGYTFNVIIDAFYQLMMENIDPFITVVSDLAVALFVPFMIGSLLTLVYTVIISIVFYFIQEPIVVDDMPVIAAFKKSVALLRQYPVKVIFFIVLIYLLMFALSSLFNMFTMAFSMSVILSLIASLLQVVATIAISVAVLVWSTRFYMAINEKEIYGNENLPDYESSSIEN